MNQPILSDKVVLVTGSTMGIGEAVVRRCVAEGGRVMIHGLEEERAARISAALNAERDGAAAYTVADLTDPETAPRLVAAVVERDVEIARRLLERPVALAVHGEGEDGGIDREDRGGCARFRRLPAAPAPDTILPSGAASHTRSHNPQCRR